MKKCLLRFPLLLFIVLTSTAVHAQQWTLGVASGINWSKMANKVIDNDRHIGWQGEIQLAYALSPHWEIATGLGLIRKGWKDNGAERHVDHHKEHFNYLSIPLTVKRYWGNGQLRPFLTGGISTNIFLNSHFETTSQVATTDYIHEMGWIYFGENYKTVDIGFITGVGAVYTLRPQVELMIAMNHELGLTDIMETSNRDLTARHSSFMLRIGVRKNL